MKDIYLVKYSVRGIKTLDQMVSLSFYKKTIPQNPATQEYNVKGIYGTNGSGKSGIVTSVDILKNLLVNPGYLNNPIVQKNLDAIVNKKNGELYMEAEYMIETGEGLMLFRYDVSVARANSGKFEIAYEELFSKKAVSKSDTMETIFKVAGGELTFVRKDRHKELLDMVLKRTINLLSAASMCALFYEKSLTDVVAARKTNAFFTGITTLLFFGKKLHVYLDEADDHRNYIIQSSLGLAANLDSNSPELNTLMGHFLDMDSEQLDIVTVSRNIIVKRQYGRFEKTVGQLCEFLRIFKSDLQTIEIDKKENDNVYLCDLVMVYDSCRIYAEFESTGIKKLIRLFAYLREMVRGGIVFIDEFDSNLHDVYLCAMLEYLMEYGEGQLCFTTHNVGPMDILKRHKKSIDFLSDDHKIYPWTTNGNYSPSRLYRNGMIEGSPFNVDSIDFIGVFSPEEEDE